jgi:hypothetical protein
VRAALSNVKRPWTPRAQLDSPSTEAATAEPAGEAHEQSKAVERFLCEVCGDVIGVFEPLVMRTVENERATSRAAEPELRARDGAYFHRECHESAAG